MSPSRGGTPLWAVSLCAMAFGVGCGQQGKQVAKTPGNGLDLDVDVGQNAPRGGVDEELGDTLVELGGQGLAPHADPGLPALCGDGVQNGYEECDDGGLFSGDGCSSTCRLERCGDGVVQADEACDDGNEDSDDGCGPTCEVEFCGDGVLQADEVCDDGAANTDAYMDDPFARGRGRARVPYELFGAPGLLRRRRHLPGQGGVRRRQPR